MGGTPKCRAHTPLPVLAAMFRHLAEAASIPVAAHLDHSTSLQECKEAIDCGFTSVMFDGSRLPLRENIDNTAAVATLAASAGVSTEGEIGFVGYDAGENSANTDPQEAAKFANETAIDAMAISVGNEHLQECQKGQISVPAIRAIEAVTDVPLVIHGGSGVPTEIKRQLARDTNVCKFNVGTELRMQFGTVLRDILANDIECFDRCEILGRTEQPIRDTARSIIRSMACS
ncbi:MAG: class II fructose-bisphosphate aldolase [Gammaproteobacteria bacterium]|jgi:fructose-bisphosphate aldolase, class II|nr:class II fructose-bisphosphate aldolase [Gammaproteobacteria bacterium]MBT5603737.1 class II fructose-bisphosphate aldolase [Gammaproteobacteria bacterium]MBT6244684.1 class II fructose-bisphosphate aldolase [Gammaproteobacteria bacterium]